MKDLNYYKLNAEEDYIKTPISVLRYITEIENELYKQLLIQGVVKSFDCGNNRVNGDVKCLEQCGECKECYN